MIGRVLGMTIGLVIQLLLVRVLSKEDFGGFAWALSIVTLVTAIIPLGLDRIDSRFMALADEEGDDRRLVGVLVTEALVITTLGSIVFLAVLAWHTRLAPGIAPSETAANLLVLLVLLAPLGALDAMVIKTFATFADARAVFFRRYLLEPGLRLIVILAVYAAGAGVYGLTVGYVLASFVGLAIYIGMVVRLLSKLGVLGELHGKVTLPVRAMVVEGVPMMASTLVYVVVTALPTLVLGATASAVEVASLRAVQPIASVSLAASGAFWVLYPPLVARQWRRGDRLGIRLGYWRTALWIAIVSYPGLLLGVAFAEPTTVTLLGHQYATSAPLLAVTALGFWFQSSTGFAPILLATAGRLRFLFWANIASLAIGIASSFWLIPRYQAWGAALAMTITLVLGNIVRQLGLRGLPPGMADRRVARPFLVMVAGLILATLLQQVAHLGFVLAVLVSAAITLAALAVTLPYLDVANTFPELLKLPVAGPAITAVLHRGRHSTTNPYLVAAADAPTADSGTTDPHSDPTPPAERGIAP